MSDKKKEDPKAAPAKGEEGAAKKKAGIMGLLTKLPVLLGGAMLIEGVVLVAGMKMMGGGAQSAAGSDVALHKEGEKGEGKEVKEGEDKKAELGEITIVDFKAPNKQSGRLFMYDVTIVASIKDGQKPDDVKTKVEACKGLIADRIRTIIAQLDPAKLDTQNEPGLETLRRQVKYQLDQILGEKVIDEVLVTKCNPFRADF